MVPLPPTLFYLAVAHYGRGRGEWAASEYPPFWRDAVGGAIERDDAIAAIRGLRAGGACDPDALARALHPRLAAIVLDVLATLYPDAGIGALPVSTRSAENAPPSG